MYTNAAWLQGNVDAKVRMTSSSNRDIPRQLPLSTVIHGQETSQRQRENREYKKLREVLPIYAQTAIKSRP